MYSQAAHGETTRMHTTGTHSTILADLGNLAGGQEATAAALLARVLRTVDAG
jgi:hypothetical protein